MSTLRDQQLAFAGHLRNPGSHAPPEGFDARAIATYRRLHRNTLEQLLAANFPVIHATVDSSTWSRLISAFCADRSVGTPLFPRMGGEFVRHLEAGCAPVDPPWLAELAHHEWTETELRIDPAPAPAHASDGDVLTGIPVVSPWLRVNGYDWPVHLIGPSNLPAHRPGAPTWLLARRDADGEVRFSELSAWTARLLVLLLDNREDSGERIVSRLAIEAGCHQDAGFLEQARALLRRLHAQGSVLGTHSGA